MRTWNCFWAEPTKKVRVTLRRYIGAVECQQPLGFHNAAVVIGESEGEQDMGRPPTEPERLDPRWPKTCVCGYKFHEADGWQWNAAGIYTGNGQEFILWEAPVGAMWDAVWMHTSYRGPDGKCLVLMTPGGEWYMDGPASNGGRWTRTGTPPQISVTPSILKKDAKFHGFLTDGILREI